MKVLGRFSKTQIMKEEVQGAVKQMKAGLDGCAVECLKIWDRFFCFMSFTCGAGRLNGALDGRSQPVYSAG